MAAYLDADLRQRARSISQRVNMDKSCPIASSINHGDGRQRHEHDHEPALRPLHLLHQLFRAQT